MRIMIVDDEEFVHKVFLRVLTKLGHQVIGQAYDGEEAVKMFKRIQQETDIILMDHRMPIKDGVSATVEILDSHPQTTIVFVTADESIINKAIENGASMVLTKPIRRHVLVEALDSLDT